MGAIDEKVLKAVEKAGDTVLKHSERWSFGQKLVAFFICFLAAAALVSGVDKIRVISGVSIALFGVAFLTFRRRVVESEKLILKDSNGKPRIVLSADSGFVFFDDDMSPKMVMNVFEGQPVIHLKDDQESVCLMVGENGALMGAGKNDLVGSNTVIQRGKMYLGSLDGALLNLDARDDSVKAVLQMDDKHPGLYLRATDSSATARVGHLEGASVVIKSMHDGNLGIMLENESKDVTAVLGSLEYDAHLSFIGQGKRRIAQYPDVKTINNFIKS